MKERVISAAILIPIVVAAIVAGGGPYLLLIGAAVVLAGFEYVRMVHRKGYPVALFWVWAVTLLWLADDRWGGGAWLGPGLMLLTLGSATWQLFTHKQDPTATWALALAGGLYLGVGGAYLVRLRAVPDGLWWTLTALPTVWIADSGAFFIGRRWGRHKLAPTISPKKTWEGYAAGVISGILGGLLLALAWNRVAGAPLTLTPGKAALLGALLALVTPLGDLFVSMIKREVGVKDSGTLIPGHGGVFDRIDSLLWAGVIAWALAILI